MCTYYQIYYACNHWAWGSLAKPCRNRTESDPDHHCAEKHGHPRRAIRWEGDCCDCREAKAESDRKYKSTKGKISQTMCLIKEMKLVVSKRSPESPLSNPGMDFEVAIPRPLFAGDDASVHRNTQSPKPQADEPAQSHRQEPIPAAAINGNCILKSDARYISGAYIPSSPEVDEERAKLKQQSRNVSAASARDESPLVSLRSSSSCADSSSPHESSDEEEEESPLSSYTSTPQEKTLQVRGPPFDLNSQFECY